MTVRYNAGSGDQINAEYNVRPITHSADRFFTETREGVRRVELSGELMLVIRADDPPNPIEGEIWLKETP